MTQPRPTAAEPVTNRELDETIKLAFEWGQLKLLPRTGWLRAGIEHPESVAEHSLRTAMLAGLEGADLERAATLALFHDSQETRTTDLDHVGRNYLHATSNEQITADQTAALPRPLAALLRGLVAEYEGRASLEADCARDADKLEMLLQALDYRQRGHGTCRRSSTPLSRGCVPRRGGGWGRARSRPTRPRGGGRSPMGPRRPSGRAAGTGSRRRGPRMPSDDDSLLTEMQVAELLQLHVQAVRGRRRAGTGSKLMWVGQWPRYRRSDVAVWLEANRPPGEPPRTLPDRPPGRSGAGGPGVGAPG